MQEYELAVWRKEDLRQQARFTICYCRLCQSPLAVKKTINYVIDILKHNGDKRAEQHRAGFETCPDCKRLQGLTSSDKIGLTREMKETI